MRFAVVALTAVFASAAFAQNADREQALRDIAAFATMQSKTDPHYNAVENELLPQIDEIATKRPPAEWLPALRSRYVSISERIHAQERRAVRADEIKAAGVVQPDPQSRSVVLQARFDRLGADLETGKLGLREHALHALEAAQLYYPNDSALLTLRAAKVPIATAYEMGRIPRDEYERRWNEALAAYRQQTETRARLQADMAEEDARRLGAAGRQLFEGIGRAFRDAGRPPGQTNCTTTFIGGIAQTRCY